MPGTYSELLFHVVFSTKHRQRWITPDIAERLHAYIGGIIRSEKGVLFDIGGVEDHVHFVFPLAARWVHFRSHAYRKGPIIQMDS